MALHISISAEPIAHLAGVPITNSLFTGVIVSLLLLVFALSINIKPEKQLKPKTRFYIFLEMIIEALYNLNVDIAGAAKARVFFPLIATIFIFVICNNWIGLLPGVGTIGFLEKSEPASIVDISPIDQAYAQTHDAATQPATIAPEEHGETMVEPSENALSSEESIPVPSDSAESSHADTTSPEESSAHSGPKFVPFFRAATADLNTTLALALTAMFMVQFYGVKYLGLSYFTKFLNFSNPIFTFVGVLETISEFAKIISFAFRLFGNIFAGEVLLAVISFLIPVIAPLPFLGLEIFVGMIQALVFAMLTLVFINMATISHEEEH